MYAKKTYGRGVGVPLSCGSHDEQSGALCYPPCKSGYYGVGPLCWSYCSGETVDTGADCLRKSYGRGIGKPLSCFGLSRANLRNADISNITSFMKDTHETELTKPVCLGLWEASKDVMKYLGTLAKCISSWNTLVFSVSSSKSTFLSTDVKIGIAVDVKEKKAICFITKCKGFDLDIGGGVAVNYGWFRSLDDIPGKNSVIFGSVKIPDTDIGVSFASVISAHNEYIGTIGSVSLGEGLSPLPLDAGGASCNTPEDTIIPFSPGL